MSEKNIVVPGGMLKAAYASVNMATHNSVEKSYWIKSGLEAAMRWLAENRKLPDGKEVREMLEDSLQYWFPGEMSLKKEAALSIHNRLNALWDEFQRRMFLAPEPEMIGEETVAQFCVRFQTIGEAALEAYRRGQQSKERSNG